MAGYFALRKEKPPIPPVHAGMASMNSIFMCDSLKSEMAALR